MKTLKEELSGLSELRERDISLNDIAEELSKIIELVKQDSDMVSRLSKKNKIIVLSLKNVFFKKVLI